MRCQGLRRTDTHMDTVHVSVPIIMRYMYMYYYILEMAMLKNEGAHAMAVVWPGPTSSTLRKKAQTRS